jgi:hypothetical protein
MKRRTQSVYALGPNAVMACPQHVAQLVKQLRFGLGKLHKMGIYTADRLLYNMDTSMANHNIDNLWFLTDA